LGSAGRAAVQSLIRGKKVRRWLNRAAQRSTELALTKDAPRQARHFEEAPSIGGFIAKELENVAMKMSAAGLGSDINDSAAGLSKLGGSHGTLDPKFRYGFHQGDDGDRADILVGVIGAI